MNNQDQKLKLRQQLALLTDQFIMLSQNPAWTEVAELHPELENARTAAVCAADNVWWQYRTKCTP